MKSGSPISWRRRRSRPPTGSRFWGARGSCSGREGKAGRWQAVGSAGGFGRAGRGGPPPPPLRVAQIADVDRLREADDGSGAGRAGETPVDDDESPLSHRRLGPGALEVVPLARYRVGDGLAPGQTRSLGEHGPKGDLVSTGRDADGWRLASAGHCEDALDPPAADLGPPRPAAYGPDGEGRG